MGDLSLRNTDPKISIISIYNFAVYFLLGFSGYNFSNLLWICMAFLGGGWVGGEESTKRGSDETDCKCGAC